jgi:hypothetical protein
MSHTMSFNPPPNINLNPHPDIHITAHGNLFAHSHLPPLPPLRLEKPAADFLSNVNVPNNFFC